jgi:DNA-binding protein YbaB
MTSAFESIISQVMADLEKQREELTRLQREMPEINGSAKSKRRQVSATVDARGDVVNLKFHGTGYRSLAPAELANVIIETIRDARAEAQKQLWDVVGDAFPEGMEFADLTTGNYDWSDTLALPKPLLDMLEAAPATRGVEFEEFLGNLFAGRTDPSAGYPSGEEGAGPGDGTGGRPPVNDRTAAEGADPGEQTTGGKPRRRDE